MKKLYLWFFAFFGLTALSAQDPTARVQIIHNSPSPTVDIYADETLLFDNVEFRTATEFFDASAGVLIEIGIAPEDSESAEDAIVTFPVEFEADKTYVVIAGGIVGNLTTPFTLFVTDMGREAAADSENVDVAFHHGSPAAPAVSIVPRGGDPLFADVSYGDITPYTTLPPDAYFLDVAVPSLGNSTLATVQADLRGLAGTPAVVFASGLLAGEPGLGVFAALPDGMVVELPFVETARLQVIHNSPSPDVDIYVNGDLLLEDFAFRTATPFMDVVAGQELNIGVAAAGSTSVEDTIANFPVTLTPDGTFVVTAGGVVGDENTPFNLFINDMAREVSSDEDLIGLSVFHGAPDAPNVDVDARGTGTLVNDLGYGNYTDYLFVPDENLILDVRGAGSPDVVATFEADLTELGGSAATVFASGFLGAEPGFGLFAALPNGTVVELPSVQRARLQVIHNSPEPTVDVYVNGELLIDDFEFRTATPFIDVPAGEVLNIGVAPGTSNSVEDTIANFPVTLEDSRTYVVTAGGIVGDEDTPFNLFINDMGLEGTMAPDSVAIAVFHGAPDAPNVDVDARLVGTLVSDLAYGDYTGYLTVPATDYLLDVRAAASPDIVASFAAELTGLDGDAITVFASGLLGADPAFGLFAALPNGTVVELPVTEVARLQVIHNAPSPTVDIYVNDALLLNDFEFRTATPFIDVDAGVELNIGVAPAGSTSVEDTIANFPVILENGRTYVVTAGGVVGDENTPFNLFINDMGQESTDNDDQVALSIFHGSPDAPNVAVDARGTGTLVDDLAYGAYTDYLAVPAETYILDIRAAGSPDIVATFEADVSGLGGGAATVFASGFLGQDPAFGLFAALPDGTIVELPAVERARLQVIHNSPSPTVDVYVNDVLLLDNFAFRTASPFVTVPAGEELVIGVAPDDSESPDDAIATFPVTLVNGMTYVVIATGILENEETPFDLAIFDMGQEAAANGGVDLLVYHGSPDAPTVDVVVDGSGAILVDDISYGEFQGYANVPAGTYTLNITPGDDNENVVATFNAALDDREGGALTIFATGLFSGENPAFDLWFALPNGLTGPLESVTVNRLEEQLGYLSIAPNPVRDWTQLRYELIEEQAQMQIRLFDMNRRLLQQTLLGTQPAGEYSFDFDLGRLQQGVYIVSMQTAAGIASRRLIVTD